MQLTMLNRVKHLIGYLKFGVRFLKLNKAISEFLAIYCP